jgi:hypothetical protein
MKFYAFVVFATLMFVNIGFSQGVTEGRIVDSQSNKPIPYVNIGIPTGNIGTVSDSNGNFKLQYRSDNDMVMISAIGYRGRQVSVPDLLQAPVVFLEPITYTMDEIVVEEQALGELKELGYHLKKRRQSIGFGSTLLGTEIGALIRVDRETVVEEAFFTFNRARGEQLLFRVNLYRFENGSAGENLIPENVLVQSPESATTVSVDLSSYNITVQDDILLSLEWVDAVTLEENELQGIAFRADKSRRGSNTYLKTTSFAPFISTDPFVKYRLGFYITARQVR